MTITDTEASSVPVQSSRLSWGEVLNIHAAHEKSIFWSYDDLTSGLDHTKCIFIRRQDVHLDAYFSRRLSSGCLSEMYIDENNGPSKQTIEFNDANKHEAHNLGNVTDGHLGMEISS